MRPGRRLIYWDACLLIAYISREICWPTEVLEGIDDLVSEVDSDGAILLTSTITRTEIFMGKLTTEQKQTFCNVFKRRNVRDCEITARIADRASSIREHYSARGVKIATPDAIHLATAIIYKVDVMYTLDGVGRCRPSSMLRLNGMVAGTALKIEKPWRTPPPQSSLFDGA